MLITYLRNLIICCFGIAAISSKAFSERFHHETTLEYKDRVAKDLNRTLIWMKQQERTRQQCDVSPYKNKAEQILSELRLIAEEETQIEKLEQDKVELNRTFKEYLASIKAENQKLTTAIRVKESEEYQLKIESSKKKQLKALMFFALETGFDKKLQELYQRAANPDRLRDDLQYGWFFKRHIKVSHHLRSAATVDSCKNIAQSAHALFYSEKAKVAQSIEEADSLDEKLKILEDFITWQNTQFLKFKEKIIVEAIYNFSVKEIEQHINKLKAESKFLVKKQFNKFSSSKNINAGSLVNSYHNDNLSAFKKFKNTYANLIFCSSEKLKGELEGLWGNLDQNLTSLNSVWSETKFLPLQLSFFYRG